MANPGSSLYPSSSLYPGGLTEGPIFEIDAKPHAIGVTVPIALSEGTEAIDLQNLKDYAAANLNEEFASRQGGLPRYYPYLEADRVVLSGQRHVDIRSMIDSSRFIRLTISGFSNYTVGALNSLTMGGLEALGIAAIPNENWSVGTISLDATRHNWRVLTVPITTGTNTITSIALSNQEIISIDAKSGFDDNDYLSLALPSFPLSSINLSQSYLMFTSHPDAVFDIGPTSVIHLDTSEVTLIQGNSEFRVKRSKMMESDSNFDPGSITGVRIVLVATGSASFKLMGIRLLDKNWKYGREDINTYFGELQGSVSRNGDPNVSFERNSPIMWRSASTPGISDPRPINAEIGTAFYTGSVNNSNEISLYFREVSEDLFTQLDIDGTTMANLNGEQQPDLGLGGFAPRPQSDFDTLQQSQIDHNTQFALERTPDLLSASWIQFACRWGPSDTSFTITNTENGGYSFNLGAALTANSHYLLVTKIEDNSVRMIVYPISSLGEILIDQVVFDSSLIDDDSAYKRRKGRFGWSAILRDADAAVRSIRERGVTYAEYKTLPYASQTPVDGAQLSTESTANFELFNDTLVPTDDSIILSKTGVDTWQMDNPTGRFGQGVRSNQFVVSDFAQSEISFELFYTGTSNGLNFVLVSADGYRIPLTNPAITPNLWQPMRLGMPVHNTAQTGPYRFVILQNESIATTARIRNLSIFKRSISWYARPVGEIANPNDTWIPFGDSINTSSGGVLFAKKAKRFQVLGRGHFEGASINRLQFSPRYATLGRFSWPEDRPSTFAAPVSAFSSGNIGRIYTFTSTGVNPDNDIISWYWTISDGGQHYGPTIQHTFTESGTFGVTLTVTNRKGFTSSSSTTFSVA